MPATKQLRLNDPAQIKRQVKEFLGKKINIVLKDNTVMFGEINSVNDTGVILKNMRLKKTLYPFDNITEIYFDTFA